ncbi:MAG: rhodanese-like domain-containing protein [Solirubrobacterales bacterium]
MTHPERREVSANQAWQAARGGAAQILDLRTGVERRRHGWPPGARRVSLLRHLLWPKGPGTIYLCQHANRSKLTRWRGAAEITDGWKGWEAAGLPVERSGGRNGWEKRMSPAPTQHGNARLVDIDRRPPRREDPIRVPEPVEGSGGLFVVDASWGEINPLVLASGVRTVGELEVIAHLRHRLPLLDTRLQARYLRSTIPAARNIPHTEILGRRDGLDADLETVFFCNGPQCAATPDAIGTLLDAGYPPKSILYYRGGMHDWMTLGLPTIPGQQAPPEAPPPSSVATEGP